MLIPSTPRRLKARADVVVILVMAAVFCAMIGLGTILLLKRGGGQTEITATNTAETEVDLAAIREQQLRDGQRFNPGIIDPPAEEQTLDSADGSEQQSGEEADTDDLRTALLQALESDDDELPPGWAQAYRDMQAMLEGRGPGQATRNGEAEDQDEEEDTGLLTLNVHVVHQMTGLPVAGARVEISNIVGYASANEIEQGPISAAVSRNGSASVRVIPPSDPRFQTPNVVYVDAQGIRTHSHDVIVRLEPVGEPIEGYVLDSEDQPVVGATIAYRPGVYTNMPNVHGAEIISVDDQGYFVIENAHEQWPITQFSVSAEGFSTATRESLRPSDGLQIIRLERSNTVTLVVVWEYDDSPVTEYSYRLLNLQNFMPEIQIDAARASRQVDSHDGRTELEDISNGLWRVEVAILDADGDVTDIRTGAEFEFRSGGEAQEVVVRVDAGAGIRGTVVNEIGTPLPGAEVHFVPPIRRVAFQAQFSTAEDPFSDSMLMDLPSVTTGPDGSFEFPGVPPGDYLLMASWEDRLTPNPMLIHVEATSDSPPVHVVLRPGGVIEGHVILPEGSRLGGIRMRAARSSDNRDGSFTGLETFTDANGAYRFERLSAATYWVHTFPPNFSVRTVPLEATPGQVTVHDFNFDEMITVSGQVHLEGNTGGNLAGRNITFRRVGGFNEGHTSISPTGTYQVEIPSGEFVALLSGSSGEGPRFTVAPSPDSQTHDLRFRTGAMRIVAVYPEGEQFRDGNITIRPREMGAQYGMIFDRMDQPVRTRSGVLEGEYSVTFTSRDRQWRAQTDWIDVRPGAPTEFILEIESTFRGERIGGWNPQTISTDMRWHNFQITSTIPAGTYEVLAVYERGSHAVATGGALAVGPTGDVIAQQFHGGWTGMEHAANAYYLTIPEGLEAGEGIIRLQLRSDGGTDSHGSVYLHRR